MFSIIKFAVFAPTSKFYIQNAELRVQEGEGITISEDKSKIIINTENLDVWVKYLFYSLW